MEANVTYMEAAAFCATLGLGAHLATPRNADENQCAVTLFGAGSEIRLGYIGSETEGSFVGVDGLGAVTYTSWAEAADEPSLPATNNTSVIVYTLEWIQSPWYTVSISEEHEAWCQLSRCYRPDCL